MKYHLKRFTEKMLINIKKNEKMLFQINGIMVKY
mgnify:CR=1 FL=1